MRSRSLLTSRPMSSSTLGLRGMSMYTVPMIKQSCPLSTSSTLGMSLGDPVQDSISDSGVRLGRLCMKCDVPGTSFHFFVASFSTDGLRIRNLTKYMLAYWCLYDLLMVWMVNEGVESVRGRTAVGSRAIVVGGTILANC